jgi:hypothetical protein
MEQVAEAHRLVESEERLGAIVIAIGDGGDVQPSQRADSSSG